MPETNYPDVIGRSWAEAEALLGEAGLPYSTDVASPTKHFFPVDEQQLYVIRGRYAPDGALRLTLAAKALKRPEPEITM